MSGYLQRFARNAMTPARSIHPAVGSIFSPPKDEMPAPLMEYEEIETVRNRAESVAPSASSRAATRGSHAGLSRKRVAASGPSRQDGGIPA